MAGVTAVRHNDHLLTPDNCALAVIDYQPEQVDSVGSISRDELMLNVTAVARAAVAYNLPVVLSTVGVELGANTPTIPEVREQFSQVPEIDRTTLNSWEDPDFRTAIEATGRRKVIMTGLWTEVCVAFPTLDMIDEGYEIYPVTDAIGGISPTAHDSAVHRMVQAGAHPVTAISLTAELQRDWGRDNAQQLRAILQWYFPERQRMRVHTTPR
ncbi:isochorismatase family protein [Gordonia lacunae]|uniref:Hydrolase n=1 Tax=Gordonia lacunae TaxID=417102 RepID=A0A243Q8W9_9ACTN|nr:isochorismatase family protein [Gordonia lacunae]OUC78085.1 hydrolase [Gordonia lacunae]